MTQLRHLLLATLVLLGAFGCQEAVVDTGLEIVKFSQVAGQTYQTYIDIDGSASEPEPERHWECRDIYRTWSFTEGQVVQAVACDLCYTAAVSNACTKEVDEYPVFYIIDSEVEIDEAPGLLQVFYGNGQAAAFEELDQARVYPDDLLIKQSDEDTVDQYLSANPVQLDEYPDDVEDWSIEYFAGYGENDLPE